MKRQDKEKFIRLLKKTQQTIPLLTEEKYLDIQTKNITCFQIEKKIFGPPGPLRIIIINGNSISLPAEQPETTIVFTQIDNKWKLGDHRAAGLAKGPQLQGPIDDAFLDPFL